MYHAVDTVADRTCCKSDQNGIHRIKALIALWNAPVYETEQNNHDECQNAEYPHFEAQKGIRVRLEVCDFEYALQKGYNVKAKRRTLVLQIPKLEHARNQNTRAVCLKEYRRQIFCKLIDRHKHGCHDKSDCH